MKLSHANHLALVAAFALPLSAQTNTFPTSGNVGIGTTSPADILSIHGGANAAVIRLTNNATGNDFVRAATTGNLEVGTFYGHALGLFTSNSDRLHIDSVGNVGIGTTAPEAKLHVSKTYATPTDGIGATTAAIFSNNNAATADSAISILSRSSASSRINFGSEIGEISGQISYSPSSLGELAAGSMLFKTLGSERMRIDGSGNVGIGTTNPTQKLSVNGIIRAKEVIVDTGWSDYVFAKDYQLTPLSEVEHAIEEDGHLPGIPSAQEVAERGVSVGEMQSRLLAKIEELTLHQIALEKENRALRTRVTALEQR